MKGIAYKFRISHEAVFRTFGHLMCLWVYRVNMVSTLLSMHVAHADMRITQCIKRATEQQGKEITRQKEYARRSPLPNIKLGWVFSYHNKYR
jgi:hypothetical protein